MPAAIRIKVCRYGKAIGLLLERGGTFQTPHERKLIVNTEQKRVLKEAGLIESNGWNERSTKDHNCRGSYHD